MLMVCVGIVGRWHFNAENVGKRYIAFVAYVMISGGTGMTLFLI